MILSLHHDRPESVSSFARFQAASVLKGLKALDSRARRKGLTALVDRIATKSASPQARKDAVDLMFALTSYPTFASLSAGRSRDEACKIIQTACHAALAPLA